MVRGVGGEAGGHPDGIEKSTPRVALKQHLRHDGRVKGEPGLMFIGFFPSPSPSLASDEWVVLPCLHKKGEGKREKEGNEKHRESWER